MYEVSQSKSCKHVAMGFSFNSSIDNRARDCLPDAGIVPEAGAGSLAKPTSCSFLCGERAERFECRESVVGIGKTKARNSSRFQFCGRFSADGLNRIPEW